MGAKTSRQGIPVRLVVEQTAGVVSRASECTRPSARLERPCRLNSGEESRPHLEPPRSHEHDYGMPRRPSSNASCPG